MVQTSTHIAGRPTIFEDRETDLHRSDRGLSLFAQTLLENTTIKPRQKKRLLTIWLIGQFNTASFDAAVPDVIGSGTFESLATGPQNYRLAWHSPYGPIMMLAQVYRQENGFFAAVVVAGVKDNAPEAMGAAEWALSRLSSG